MERIDSALLEATGSTMFFARQLEHVKTKTYDIRYPNLRFSSGELIPISNDAGPAAETITYQQWDQTGLAKIVANYADDIPTVNVAGKEFTQKVKSIATSYVYSIQEIRAAQAMGRPLDMKMARAARRANDELVNTLAMLGDVEYGLVGLLTHPNVPDFDVANDGAGPSRLWTTKTPALILRDMLRMETEIQNATNGVEAPDTLLLPNDQYALIMATPLSAGSDTTILQFFLANSHSIKTVKPVFELKGKGTGGVDVMIAYRNDPEYLTLEIPQDFEQLPVQERNLTLNIPCHSRFGGVIIYYPLAIVKGEGI